MGRAKLEMKYIENSRARRATYKTRMTGLKKKASELFVLCGVDALVASSSPENNTVQSWPEYDSDEFRRIKQRYIQFRRSQMETPFPSPSSSLPLVSQEMVAMSSKLTEIRERLNFLEGEASSNALVAPSHFQQDQTALQVQDIVPPSPSLADISMEDIQFFLSDLPLSAMDEFNSSHFQQDQTALHAQETIPQSPFLTNISMEDIQFFLSDLPMNAMSDFNSDLPKRSTMEDFNWLIDYE